MILPFLKHKAAQSAFKFDRILNKEGFAKRRALTSALKDNKLIMKTAPLLLLLNQFLQVLFCC